MNILIKNTELFPDQNGFYNLDAVYEALKGTDQFVGISRRGDMEGCTPIAYLESGSAKKMTKALLSMNKDAYRVDYSPNGGVFVCKELLVDYARYRSPEVFIDLINQIFPIFTDVTLGFEATAPNETACEHELSLSEKLNDFSKRLITVEAGLDVLSDQLARSKRKPDSPFMDWFWNQFEELNHDELRLDHSIDGGFIAVNMTHIIEEFRNRGIQLPERRLIKWEFKRSQRYPFVETKSLKSAIWKNNTWCFVFKRG